MAKTKVARNPAIDPTLPKIELKLGGKTYFLVFTFAALAMAEAKLREVGITANLLTSIDLGSWDATKLVPLLYAALITHDPDITPTAVAQMIQFRDLPNIINGLYTAWNASIEEAKPDGDAPLAIAE